MEVIKCGTNVVLKLTNIKGMITCASIRFNNITYEVTYCYNMQMNTVWCNEFEFEIDNPEITKIGFKK